jgi:hypothetical protein
MTRTTALKSLFEKWKASPGHDHSFVEDGIINERKLDPRRVLFLCKEPNQSPSRTKSESERFWTFQEFWEKDLWGAFSISIATWAHGVLNNFVPYDLIPPGELISALHSIAFMNIKKSGGLGKTNSRELTTYAAKHKDLIERQVEIIEPTLIIASINCSAFKRILFHEPPKSSDHGIDVYNWMGIPVIDFYHPSARGSVCLSYALLKLAIESEVVQERLRRPPW